MIYKKEKAFHVQDDWLFMDIFNFFASRDLDLEATILAEKELEVLSIDEVENRVVVEDTTRATDVEEAMDFGFDSLPEFTLSRAEMFYLECQLKNPKDEWSEFTMIYKDNFDFSKTASFLNQKCKNYFVLEKRKGNAMKCFGLKYTEDIVFKNWLNRKPEQ